MRAVGLDLGLKRIGIAVSDETRTLARPVGVLRAPNLDAVALEQVALAMDRLAQEDGAVDTVVIGLPRRLDGSPTDLTPRVEAFAKRLSRRTGLPVVFQDERLSSREAESLLALREKNWRARKARLDAASAAVILQEYLDRTPRSAEAAPSQR